MPVLDQRRPHEISTTLALRFYEIAISEYHFNVEFAWRRLQFFIWVPMLRWGLQSISMSLQRFAPTALSAVINCLSSACGIAFSIVGIIVCMRGRRYYRAARDAVKRIEDVYGESWVSPLATPSTMQGDAPVHGIKIWVALLYLLGFYIVVDVVSIVIWVLAGAAS